MDKKELKFYDAPACEVVELKLSSVLCGSAGTSGGSDDIDPENIDEGFGS